MKQFLVVLVVVAVSVIAEGEGSSYCMTSTGLPTRAITVSKSMLSY